VTRTQDHPSREQLTYFATGRLSSADLGTVAEHIDACDVCSKALREIPDDDFVARVRSAATPPNAGDTAAGIGPTSLPRELLEHPRYKIGRFLGRGGMGAVYQAAHRLMDRQVALKIIHGNLSKHPRVVERFRQEVKAAAKLSHPNIVAAYDADQAGELHFLVMEFVDGMSLAQLVNKRGPLEVAYACHFVRQAAKGLHHAFEAGMVHRDLKPHNLMLTRKGQVKILDFGLARLAVETRADLKLPATAEGAGLTQAGDIMGTPDYMAPEQLLDPTTADTRADIFSLGCSLYFLLTGLSPFAHINERSVLMAPNKRQHRPIVELRRDLPSGLVAVIEKMLAPNPAERFTTPAEVVKVLAPFARPSALPAPAPTPPTPTVKTPRTFAANCPFCHAKLRIHDKALGASIACTHCHSYFTAVPSET
jgi:serine/threonine protein kinase